MIPPGNLDRGDTYMHPTWGPNTCNAGSSVSTNHSSLLEEYCLFLTLYQLQTTKSTPQFSGRRRIWGAKATASTATKAFPSDFSLTIAEILWKSSSVKWLPKTFDEAVNATILVLEVTSFSSSSIERYTLVADLLLGIRVGFQVLSLSLLRNAIRRHAPRFASWSADVMMISSSFAAHGLLSFSSYTLRSMSLLSVSKSCVADLPKENKEELLEHSKTLRKKFYDYLLTIQTWCSLIWYLQTMQQRQDHLLLPSLLLLHMSSRLRESRIRKVRRSDPLLLIQCIVHSPICTLLSIMYVASFLTTPSSTWLPPALSAKIKSLLLPKAGKHARALSTSMAEILRCWTDRMMHVFDAAQSMRASI